MITTTAATDSSTSETPAAVVASPPSLTGFPSAPPASATPHLRPGEAGGAASSAMTPAAPGRSVAGAWPTYRRAVGSGRWTLRHVQRMAPATVAATYAVAARSPEWDATWNDDPAEQVITARSLAEASGYLLEAA